VLILEFYLSEKSRAAKRSAFDIAKNRFDIKKAKLL